MTIVSSGRNASSFDVGRDVFGPILAEFMLRLWAFASSLPHPRNTKLLFCARGGLRLKLLFEDFLTRTELPVPVDFDHIMISRLVAVRPALLRREEAALDELSREFKGASLSDAAHALSQTDVNLDAAWSRPFSRSAFVEQLWADRDDSRQLLQAIEAQHCLFCRHFNARRGPASEVILCDTGLNGSTVKLLTLGMPEVDLSCVLFARSNYKGFDTEHFGRTAGLSIERDAYSAFAVRTALFRYWQLFEDLLEPRVPSVRTFVAEDDIVEPISNLEIDGWQAEVAPQGTDLFAGACGYFRGLDRNDVPAKLAADSQAAWQRLRRLVIRPTAEDVRALRIGDRSRDFGRIETVPTFATKRGVLPSLASSLWKEGNIALTHPRTRHIFFAGIEGAYLARPIVRRAKHQIVQMTSKLSRRGRMR